MTQIRYSEWLSRAHALRGVVTVYWQVTGYGSNITPSVVLPDGHVEVVLNFGERVGLAGPAYTGDQPDRAVVGLLSHALRLEYKGNLNTFGIRFHPARGAGFLGKAAAALAETLAPLHCVCPSLDLELKTLTQAHPGMEGETARDALDRVLLAQLRSAPPPDAAVVAAVDRLTDPEIVPPVAQLAGELKLSCRQLQRRFLVAVGIPPKRFVRVVRFARAWQAASMGPEESWANLAAQYGYADQAHLVREFRSFGAEPPTRVFTKDWYRSTELVRVSGPAEGVRPV